MLKKGATFLAVFLVASAILVVSVLRSASVRYAFSQSPSPTPTANDPAEIEIDYQLPFPGRILPDSPFWPIKAARDRIWIGVTPNPLKKAQLYLLFADKRVSSALTMFERDKSELGVSTLTKAEKYLEQANFQAKEARERGGNTTEFYANLANSSLKHRQIMEDILVVGPEDAKPIVIATTEYARQVFEEARIALGEMGREVPHNPFEE
ncbi:hypothetical protein A2630_04060 [Candidatus Woesebacteria bacterium RIFCSPHIGHO2_01_FULL_44_10]|uniref:DUF5667 domain-containing protein n=1 Tax=Candidatus Woesebacteria bacterium RIFCSPLOWO2_01_FULL_44_14 TaxID=1802525 RepID=A0A1F8C1P9_9BACT|nr:MAG: hypothetical protein A2630_04060 [Candidatus Woesebacteria bacterium RIFCSPHIGHO2_01_FULL_44_10]OGM56389.1 MAG: hypothetical protein A3F62_04770 [Candidatus Woesebacteria bacterium RIFCSPHIGHO2_12_FULL_44_11]OGM69749.1 MAG: hypothetical protein A2975_02780 [Candidatus Woesebacteria bacterium RIFCSPLOWO2_01_FULL_44_14]